MRSLIFGALLVLVAASNCAAQALFPIEVGHKWGYIDSIGHIVIPPKYALACAFNEDRAWVVEKSRSEVSFDENAMNAYESVEFEFQRSGTDYVWVVIDTKGNQLGSTDRTKLKPLVYNDHTPIFDGDYFHGGWGLIDATGKITQAGQFGSIGFVNERLVKVSSSESGGPYGFLDLDGKVISTVQYNEATSFSEGLAAAEDPETNKWGFLGPDCKWAIKPIFGGTGSFHEGLAYFGMDSLYGYIDKNGKVAIKDKFIDADNFSEGLARVKINGKYGYINKTGALVIPPTIVVPVPKDAFSMNMRLHTFREGLALFEQSDKIGYIDKTGKVAIAARFEDGYTFEHGLARVKKDGKWCYIDRTGKIVWQHA